MSTRSKGNADQVLGMQEPIRRRDFLNATLLAAGGALVGAGSSRAPAEALAPGYGGVGDYSRSNGNTPEVMEAAHAIRDGCSSLSPRASSTPARLRSRRGRGGHQRARCCGVLPRKEGRRCLVLDNHPIFGGEAKRNEFLVDGQLVTGHQGSAFFRCRHRAVSSRASTTSSAWTGRRSNTNLARPRARDSAQPDQLRHARRAARDVRVLLRRALRPAPGMWVIDPWGKKLDGAPMSAAAEGGALALARGGRRKATARSARATPCRVSSTP